MKIRKQVYELTPNDIEKFPVWEFALDEEGKEGQDEATVKPIKSKAPLNPDEGIFVVKATFVLANGKKYLGYLTPPVQGENSIEMTQPIIVTDKGQVRFWNGIIKPKADIIRKNYSILNVTKPSEVFPLNYESSYPISTEAVNGQLTGFMYLAEEKGQDVIKEVQ